MDERKSRVAERCRMSHISLERGLSEATEDMIVQRFLQYQPDAHAEMEAEAAKITAIIESSETEAEIVEKLRAL